jgi:hypothetical protein
LNEQLPGLQAFDVAHDDLPSGINDEITQVKLPKTTIIEKFNTLKNRSVD